MTPLFKRLPRDFLNNLGKYLGILLLMGLATAFSSGFLGAGSSMHDICEGMRETYNIEDFNFTTMYEMDGADIAAVEDLGARVCENFYRDVDLVIPGSNSELVTRVFRLRGEEINQAIYNDGTAPANDAQIALDRVFCANNELSVGDTVQIAGRDFKISGIMVLADHSVSYKSSNDFMFNSVSRSVSQLSDKAFEDIVADGTTFQYSVLLNDRDLSDADRISFEEDLVDLLSDRDVAVTDLVDSAANIGITFASSDVDGDMFMWQALMYILIMIMAFVFVVLTDATIEQESAVIGTLLASGYRKRELVVYYLILPMFIGFAGILVGNIVGANWLILPMKNLYYNSYNLPPFELHWHWETFLLTSLVPFALLLAITFIGLIRKLGASPLQFLRNEVARTRNRGGLTLPERLPYGSRFRLRVFMRNVSHFATLFVGILFGSVLLLLGLVMLPIVDYNAELMADDVPAEHLYTLKAQIKLDGTEEERRAWAAAEELTTNPAYDVLDLDLLEDLENQLNDLGISFDDVSFSETNSGEGGGFELPDYIKDAIEESINEEIDPSDPILLATLRQLAQAADINIEDATDEQLSVLISTADTFHRQIHELDDEHIKLVEDLLSDLMDCGDFDELEDPINQTSISGAVLSQVEKFAVTSVSVERRYSDSLEEVTVYGIQENSRYWDDFPVEGSSILVGEGFLQKCAAQVGEPVELVDRFQNKTYLVAPVASCGNATDTSIYMSLETFNELFENEADYFNGYASNEELPLDERYVASELTPEVMASMSDQMHDSMGSFMVSIVYMVVPVYLVLIYLLTKTVIDRSARAISYMKVFGYHEREIDGLYVRAITITVIASLILNIPLVMWTVNSLVPLIMSRYSGNFIMYYPPSYMVRIVAIGLGTYLVVAALHIMRIRRVPLALALKVQE